MINKGQVCETIATEEVRQNPNLKMRNVFLNI